MYKNPFVYGRVVENDEFFDRKGEMRRLMSRIGNGQSTAIVGLPHSGKTSLLKHLQSELTGEPHTIVEFVDSTMLPYRFEQADFWGRVLLPIEKACEDVVVQAAYQNAQANQFGSYMLEQLFAAMAEQQYRFVLLLDEFDALLTHPVLNSGEFYGSLRSLASRFSSFTLTIACIQPLSQLNQETQTINPHGSPYFNIFIEIVLKPFPRRHAADLLRRAGDRFDRHDRALLFDLSGRHPYLLQLGASILWERSFGDERDNQRYKQTARELHHQAKSHFDDVWRRRPTAECKALTIIGLAELHGKIGNRHLHISELSARLEEFSPELTALKREGTVIKNENGTYHIAQEAMLWWLADELKRIIRDDSSFKEWLHAQEFDGILTTAERRRIREVAQTISSALGQGALALIEGFAAGYAGTL